MLYFGRGVFHRAGEKVESMDNAIALADGGLGEIVMHKLNGVRKQECFGVGMGYVEAALVVECWTDVEAFAAAEVPRYSRGWLVVDYDCIPHGSDGCGIKVEGSIVVLPGRH